ncbi:uncharacterized protein BX664DRAFT_263924 [Halteromyces radiatus]|uniref:uncharacterized protein n=1 Tax=Halteromyces radiatus TaxID=101107 RepID=UPI00221F65CF|nr:uncharacterized protein BX664DRAFT_263924 [Halteromyces radiatus]KAI8089311.1 hypothetical protein BX664DRAFT_263924 [Halteromyces radiatus]
MSQDTAATQAKILKQVEFYFGDSNLPYDKFLWNKTKENDGVDIQTIADFKKMKMICNDLETIVAALKEGPSDLLEVNDKKQVRRKTEVEKQDHTGRSIYAKSFAVENPTEDGAADLLKLQDDIEAFFEKYGKVLSVRMRKDDKAQFKGSVFVEFSTPEEAKKVAEMELEYKNNKLEIMTKLAYLEKKKEQYKDAPRAQHKKKSFNAFFEQSSKQQKGKKNTKNNNAKRDRETDAADADEKDDVKRQRADEE